MFTVYQRRGLALTNLITLDLIKSTTRRLANLHYNCNPLLELEILTYLKYWIPPEKP